MYGPWDHERVGHGSTTEQQEQPHLSAPSHLQSFTLSSSWARTFVGVDEVNACSSILAGLRKAFIDLLRAVDPMIAWNTLQETVQSAQPFLWLVPGTPGDRTRGQDKVRERTGLVMRSTRKDSKGSNKKGTPSTCCTILTGK